MIRRQNSISVKFIVAVIIAIILHSCGSDDEPTLDQKIYVTYLQSQVDSITAAYVPDKRVGIVEVSAKPGAGDTVILSGETNHPDVKPAILRYMEKEEIPVVDSIDQLEYKRGLVTISVANLRSEPAHSAELSTQALMGMPLKIYNDKEEYWFRVQTPDNYLGWMDKGGMVQMDTAQWRNWIESEKVVFIEPMGFVYEQPDIYADKVSDVVGGNVLLDQGRSGAYTKVVLPDERSGYILSEHLEPFDSWVDKGISSQEQILETAKEFTGLPYLWGGTSGRGVDCSGYTKMVYFLNGLVLPRDASQQVMVGQEIDTYTSLHNLQPGDFLFFGRKASEEEKEKITHVAIYLGEGKIIHSAGRVRVQSLRPGDPDFAPDRLASFVRAKRMLKDGQPLDGVQHISQVEATLTERD